MKKKPSKYGKLLLLLLAFGLLGIVGVKTYADNILTWGGEENISRINDNLDQLSTVLSAKEGKINELTANLAGTRSTYDQKLKELDSYKSQVTTLQNEKNDLVNQVNSKNQEIQAKITEINQKIDEGNQKVAVKQQEIDGKNQEITQLNQSLQQVTTEKNELQNKYNESQEKLEESTKQIAGLNDYIKKLEKAKSDVTNTANKSDQLVQKYK